MRGFLVLIQVFSVNPSPFLGLNSPLCFYNSNPWTNLHIFPKRVILDIFLLFICLIFLQIMWAKVQNIKYIWTEACPAVGYLRPMKIFPPPSLNYRICPSLKKTRTCLWTWILDICTGFVVRAPGCTFCWIMICIWYFTTLEIPIQIAN